MRMLPNDRLLRLQNANRKTKVVLVVSADTIIALASLYLAYALRYGSFQFYSPTPFSYLAVFAIMAIAVPSVLLAMRIPWIKLSTLEPIALMRILLASSALGLVLILTGFVVQALPPRLVPPVFVLLFFFLAVCTRVGVVLAVSHVADRSQGADRVAIYGAGAAGIQLASALRQSRELKPVLFVDDDPKLNGLMAGGLPVFSAREISKRILQHRITHVLLAMPSVDPHRVKQIADTVKSHGVVVRSLPSYVDIIAHGESFGTRIVSPEELLGRGKVNLDDPMIAQAYAGNVVMVTGAGGSIGSELSRQLLECNPSAIVLFEQNEYALYAIHQALCGTATRNGIKLITRLGSVCDRKRVTAVLEDEKVDTVLHAAAYKHVPMVEQNEVEGACTNILGTHTVAVAAQKARVQRFVLISTDKAVRPTNVMGATKRLAELLVQDLASRTTKTKFSMVRFGNVLGSSGSVLPLFQKQIQSGGPVTVTDENVTRYFMTIPEAARLVLLAGSYSTGGDLFVLDMGNPMKIIDVARRMIELSGRTVYDASSGTGDIEIKITGLRPGEKRYEELLIDCETLRDTPHPKILRASEKCLSEIEIKSAIRDIELAVEEQSPERVRRVIEMRVEGYSRNENAANAV